MVAEATFPSKIMRFLKLCGISIRFRMLSPSNGQVTHVLLTRPYPPVGNISSSVTDHPLRPVTDRGLGVSLNH